MNATSVSPVQDLNAAVISLTGNVDKAVISAVRKDQLRTSLKTLKKKFDDWEKAKKADQEKTVCARPCYVVIMAQNST